MTDTAGKRAPYYKNTISGIGALIALIAALNIAFLVMVEMTGDHENPYIGIMAYAVIPAFLVFGLLLFVVGMIRERRRRKLAPDSDMAWYPVIDFNNRRHLRNFLLSVVFGVIFFAISLFGSYKAFHYTESDAFCGTLCHQIMHPEYTAYKASPHAKVGCVGCHVGEGADWYVKSKLSGAYQVYATLRNIYPRPILSPVENLRPAQETCENCHWPEKFWGAQLKVFNHFGYDESNTPRETQLLIKVGGGRATGSKSGGIHFHMNIDNEITYVPADRQHQVIPYVKVRNKKSGKVTEYFLQGEGAWTPEQVAAGKSKKMDCVGCHNRPTHIYWSPDESVDKALLSNAIDRTIPYIKAQTVDVLDDEYQTTDEAVAAIKQKLEAYYTENYPELMQNDRAKIDQAVKATQEIFKRTIFPEMKVSWKVHPSNLGHMYSAGCFRCHDNQHVAKDGKVLSKDCNLCHNVLAQQEAGRMMVETPDSVFTHPVDLGDMQDMNCIDCHSGASM